MQHFKAGVKAQLFGGFQLGRGGSALLAQRDEGGCLGIGGGQGLRNRMIGGDGDKACAKDRVGARGIDRDRILQRRQRGKAELQPLRFADPVFLHQANFFGPLVERAKAAQQFIGKLRDFQEPLVQLALFHQRARTPAAPVDDLFVGQHCLVDRVPVHRRFAAIDQACGIKVEEQRLFVPVIVGIARGEFAAPVEREAQPFELRLHVGDIVSGPAAGVDALFHRGVFRGHAEGVPPHRVQHFVADHPLVAGQHIAHRVIAHMPDVNAPRRIGKHFQHIAARLGRGIVGAKGLGVVPGFLPAEIGAGRIKTV